LVTNLSDNLNNAFNPELQLEEKLKALKVAEGLLFKLWYADSKLHNNVVAILAHKLSKDSVNVAAVNSLLNALEGNYHSVRRIIQTASSSLSS
jgi:hypothetical protein